VGANPIQAATYLVTMLDARQPNMVTTMATPGMGGQLNKLAQTGAVIDAKDVAHNFAWMRPKDLVFSYVVNNWLLGNDPPAFDVLAWNDDATNMSAAFSRDSNAMLASGKIVEPGRLTLLGTPIDLSQVKADNFIVAGERDHITTWRPCYMTSQLLGGRSDVVVVDSGHIQSFVNPIGASRYKYRAGPAGGPDPDAWLAHAEEHTGSWWPRWADWLLARPEANDQRPPPSAASDIRFENRHRDATCTRNRRLAPADARCVHGTESADAVRERPGAVTFTKTITEFDVFSFAGITGDYYPVHINAEYAAKQPVR
jgi:polyhydroxyalkanoate synthase